MDDKPEAVMVVVPVADVDRAKNFCKGLGWREDADYAAGVEHHAIGALAEEEDPHASDL